MCSKFATANSKFATANLSALAGILEKEIGLWCLVLIEVDS